MTDYLAIQSPQEEVKVRKSVVELGFCSETPLLFSHASGEVKEEKERTENDEREREILIESEFFFHGFVFARVTAFVYQHITRIGSQTSVLLPLIHPPNLLPPRV